MSATMKFSPFPQMNLQSLIPLCCIFFLLSPSSVIHAQQPYVGKSTTDCNTNSSSVLGFTCNGQTTSCQAYLIFRSQPPYTTVSSISNLLGSNISQLSQINSVSETATFDINKEVIVPVTCSCSGEHYQANSSYVVQNQDTLFIIANNTYQGLSTCQALRYESNITTTNIFAGTRISVPLRCACPTRNQTDQGVKYLVSYTVTWGETVSSISGRYEADTGRTLEANGLSEQQTGIFPFTTLLLPLQNSPTSPRAISPPPPPSPVSRPSSTLPSGSNNNTKTWVYIIVGVAVALVLFLSVVALCVFFHRRRTHGKKRRTDRAESTTDQMIESHSFESYEKPEKTTEQESEEFLESISDIAHSLKIYKFEDLQFATENFSPNCWVKGSVYRGTIYGNLVAIKKTNRDVSKEINLLNKIHHLNLIRLSGVCFNESIWYLVFEYAEKGSLTDWIYNSRGTDKVLSWGLRIQIALDVATGLNYLHSYTSPPHVHKDMKTSNVLLDSDFRAKIANLSLARSTDGQDGEFALTRHIVGTKGYMAPEYLEHGFVSPKLDVYSFGVVMLEIVTGKENAAMRRAGDVYLPEALVEILRGEYPEQKLKDLIDPSLEGNYPLDLAVLLARLIESCLRREPVSRPSMNDVVQTLSSISTNTFSWEPSVAV